MRNNWTQEELDLIEATQNLVTGAAYKEYVKVFPDKNRSYISFAEKKSRLGFCSSESKKIYWTKEKEDFIRANDNGNIQEGWLKFNEHFKDSPATLTAYKDQRCRMKMCKPCLHGSTKKRDLYSEHEKKGLVYIKVAQPSVWISKAKWVYLETHPGELDNNEYYYLFLNNNNRDFRPDNIIRIKRRAMVILNNIGGLTENPQENKLRIMQTELRLAQLDLLEKKGMMNCYGNNTRTIKKQYKYLLGQGTK